MPALPTGTVTFRHPPHVGMLGDPVGDARRAMGEQAVDRPLADGRAMTREEAVDHAAENG